MLNALGAVYYCHTTAGSLVQQGHACGTLSTAQQGKYAPHLLVGVTSCLQGVHLGMATARKEWRAYGSGHRECACLAKGDSRSVGACGQQGAEPQAV